MPERIFITGGAGFVGSAVVEELISRGCAINALTKGRSLPSLKGDVKSFKGDLFDEKVLDEGMAGCDAVIHLVGIIMEKPAKGITFEKIHHQGTRMAVDAAKRAGIKRYIQMSALGSRPDAVANYHKTKWRAEEYIRASGLDWTIIRPSMIHGPRGEFMKMEAKWAKKAAPPFIFMPYFGAGFFGTRGAGMLQPVYVKDVARAFADALTNAKTVGQLYEIGGSEKLTWPQMHRLAARAIVGHDRWVLGIPVWYANALASIAPASLLPFNRDQVIMSQEDNTCDLAHFAEDFGWMPEGFTDALGEYAGQLKAVG
jgi:uncharacterized protein YbjT (DUF2867 family)